MRIISCSVLSALLLAARSSRHAWSVWLAFVVSASTSLACAHVVSALAGCIFCNVYALRQAVYCIHYMWPLHARQACHSLDPMTGSSSRRVVARCRSGEADRTAIAGIAKKHRVMVDKETRDDRKELSNRNDKTRDTRLSMWSIT